MLGFWEDLLEQATFEQRLEECIHCRREGEKQDGEFQKWQMQRKTGMKLLLVENREPGQLMQGVQERNKEGKIEKTDWGQAVKGILTLSCGQKGACGCSKQESE